MHAFLCSILSPFILAMIGESVATILETTIRQHNQTRYSSTNLSVTQYDINSKILCAAQCARLISTCNIAVFNPLAIPSCSLYGESLMIANLVLDSKATTFHFGRNIISHGKNKAKINSFNFIFTGSRGLEKILIVLFKDA